MKKIAFITTFSILLFPFNYVSAACPNTYSIRSLVTPTKYMRVIDSVSLAPASTMTVEFWVKPLVNPSTSGFVVGKDVAGSREYDFGLIANAGVLKPYAQMAGGETATAFSPTTIPLNTWTHLAYTWETTGNTFNYYVNGVLDLATTYTTDPTNTATDLDIGRRLYDGLGAANNNAISAQIDDIRIWTVQRTAPEILANMRTEIDVASNLVASWHLNNSGEDSSGNGNTALNLGANFNYFNIPFTCGTSTVVNLGKSIIMGQVILP